MTTFLNFCTISFKYVSQYNTISAKKYYFPQIDKIREREDKGVMGRIIGEGITFDDVLLIPGYSEVIPNQVDLSTRLTNKIRLNMCGGLFY